MPSNNELAAEAVELAAKLETTVETDGLDNKELVALVKDLRAKVTDAETSTQADDQGEDEATKAAQAKKAARVAGKSPKPKRPPFYVAPGKSLTSRKGILSGDTADEVKPEYLNGGKKALDAFVESGHVLKG